MNVVFFTIYEPAIQVAMPNDKGVTAVFYRNKVLKILKSYFGKQRPKHGLMFLQIMLFRTGLLS